MSETAANSFRLGRNTIRQLKQIADHYGENKTDTIKRLIAERHVTIFGEGNGNLNKDSK